MIGLGAQRRVGEARGRLVVKLEGVAAVRRVLSDQRHYFGLLFLRVMVYGHLEAVVVVVQVPRVRESCIYTGRTRRHPVEVVAAVSTALVLVALAKEVEEGALEEVQWAVATLMQEAAVVVRKVWKLEVVEEGRFPARAVRELGRELAVEEQD